MKSEKEIKELLTNLTINQNNMAKKIKGDLILKEDTTFNESIKVEGDIKGWFNLKVKGDIDAWDIDARNINARDIDARNIDAWDIDERNMNAWDIDARNINARDIDALDIICETRTKKTKDAKTICRVYIKNKSKLEIKEQEKN